MLLQEIVTLGNIETKDLFKEKICIIKAAYYKNQKKKKGDSKYFRQCQSKCYPDILRCIFRLICIVLLICLLNFICVLNFPQIDNYRLHLGFPIKANPTCVCVCLYLGFFNLYVRYCICAATFLILKKQSDPLALILIHLIHSWQYLFLTLSDGFIC